MNVLFVITAADHWTLNDGSVHPSGFWAEEVAAPHKAFSKSGWDITIATPGVTSPTLDKLSVSLKGAPWKVSAIERYLASIDAQLSHPVVLADIHADDIATFEKVLRPR